MIILKSESKPDGGEKIKKNKKINDDKNMVQIHDEQRSFHMTSLIMEVTNETPCHGNGPNSVVRLHTWEGKENTHCQSHSLGQG